MRAPKRQCPETTRKESPAWPKASGLFPPPAAELVRALEILPEALAEVWPLKRAHRQALPRDIADLSRALTRERAQLSQPYWSKPAFISAYLYYFLPWNILRLGRLFSGLRLAPPEAGLTGVLLDVGSGPFTLPLALWLSAPEWRDLPLHVLAVDKSRQPMELGQKLFAALAEKLNFTPWRAHLRVGSLTRLASFFESLKIPDAAPALISASNVLNESRSLRRGHTIDENETQTGDNSLAVEPVSDLLDAWAPLLERTVNPRLLFVEPGTRLGGTTIMRLRRHALDRGLAPLAPCTHAKACPLLKERGGLPSSWCHFVFDTAGAPDWLRALSLDSGLSRHSLSLSPLLLGTKNRRKAARNSVPCRVISQPFATARGDASYVCCQYGKCLVEKSQNLSSGAWLMARPTGRRDLKSGVMALEAVI